MTPAKTPCDECPGVFGHTSPFWEFARWFVSVVALLTLILYFAANNFDQNEVAIIGVFATAIGIGKGAAVLFERVKK